ncbi:MAG: hypothetical protein JXA07_12730 [Spirochaetes bacterium]|nr:hypothetical protein [Spirochaetota bacterium]
MTPDVMRLNSAVNRIDRTFPAILAGLVDLAALSKDQTGVKARVVELVRDDFSEYIMELTATVERLEFLNTNLVRLIAAAKKILEVEH